MSKHCSNAGDWLLSQHQFGWPCFRPRLYSVLVNRATGKLMDPGLDVIHALYRKPSGTVADLFVAPKDAWLHKLGPVHVQHETTHAHTKTQPCCTRRKWNNSGQHWQRSWKKDQRHLSQIFFQEPQWHSEVNCLLDGCGWVGFLVLEEGKLCGLNVIGDVLKSSESLKQVAWTLNFELGLWLFMILQVTGHSDSETVRSSLCHCQPPAESWQTADRRISIANPAEARWHVHHFQECHQCKCRCAVFKSWWTSPRHRRTADDCRGTFLRLLRFRFLRFQQLQHCSSSCVPQEHINSMGVPQWAQFSTNMPFPIMDLSGMGKTSVKAMAGNVSCWQLAVCSNKANMTWC